MNLSEPAILEGIYAIIVGVVLSEGKVSRSEINYIRSLVEPSLFSTGKVRKEISRESVRNRGDGKMDTFKVFLEIALGRPAPNEMTYRSAREIGKINDKIDALILQASPFNNDSIDNLLEQRNKFLDDQSDQQIVFNVYAGGNSNQSIDVELSVSNRTLSSIQIPFHSRIESKPDKRDMEPYENIRDLANALKLNPNKVLDDIFPMAITQVERHTKFSQIQESVKQLFGLAQQDKVSVSKRSYDFLRECIFGMDYEELVDISEIDVKEVTPQIFAELERTSKINIVTRGKNELQFKDVKTGIVLFTLNAEVKSSPYIQVNFSLRPGNYGTKIKNTRKS